MKKLRILSFVLALLLLVPALVACGDKGDADINVYTLNGTTGFGMAKLMNDAKADENSKYHFTVKLDASDVTTALINGDADIAALPTNAAANVYQKTEGGVTVLAINTLGCLYMVTTDPSISISSISDLKGQTVYVPAQNPTFILTYLCRANGLTVGDGTNGTVKIDSTSYAKPDNLKDAVAAGEVKIAVLPEPMVTIATNAAKQNNVTVKNVMDLTAVWDKATTKGSLVQGCIVVRNEFLEKNKKAVENFLTAYEASINYLSTNTAEAAQMVKDNGIFANADVAKVAIPKCNVCYLDGDEMKAKMSNYLSILFDIAPASVGGALPEDDFYYNAK